MEQFLKLSDQILGKAYEEIIGYNPFIDSPSITKEEVVKLMTEFDEECKRNEDDDTFINYFTDRKII